MNRLCCCVVAIQVAVLAILISLDSIHRSLAIPWYKSGACTFYNSRDTSAFLVSFQEMVRTFWIGDFGTT